MFVIFQTQVEAPPVSLRNKKIEKDTSTAQNVPTPKLVIATVTTPLKQNGYTFNIKSESAFTATDDQSGEITTFDKNSKEGKNKFEDWAKSHGVDYNAVMTWFDKQVELMKTQAKQRQEALVAQLGDPLVSGDQQKRMGDFWQAAQNEQKSKDKEIAKKEA